VLSLLARISHLVTVVALGAVGLTGSAAASHGLGIPSGTPGHDVGNISCLGTLPPGGEFGIVGATAGRPFYPSDCLAAEYAWADSLPYRPQYYINLANPGHKSSHWGHSGPRRCHKKPKYDVGCAFNYGYTAAAAALRYVTSAGSTGRGRWWLDVEIDNTWGTSRSGVTANIRVIDGALHYLRKQPDTGAGIYTETAWWSQITHSSRQFSHLAVWGGGAGSKHNAMQNCKKHSITGGPALLAQWISGGVDHDVVC
jgi:hypothetical protein